MNAEEEDEDGVEMEINDDELASLFGDEPPVGPSSPSSAVPNSLTNDAASDDMTLRSSKKLKCACIHFSGLENLRKHHQAIDEIMASFQADMPRLGQGKALAARLTKMAAAQRHMAKALREQAALQVQHQVREYNVARSACEVMKMFAIDAPPNAPPLQRQPYTIQTTPSQDVMDMVRADIKRSRKGKRKP
jgi:hypothetical protein